MAFYHYGIARTRLLLYLCLIHNFISKATELGRKSLMVSFHGECYALLEKYFIYFLSIQKNPYLLQNFNHLVEPCFSETSKCVLVSADTQQWLLDKNKNKRQTKNPTPKAPNKPTRALIRDLPNNLSV